MRRVLRFGVVAAVFGALLASSLGGASASGATNVSGYAWSDVDRDGVKDASEPAFGGHHLYLLDPADNVLASTTTDASGAYRFDVVGGASYTIQYAFDSWDSLRRDWVPTTTGSVEPRISFTAAAGGTVDFGWRQIVRSTTLGSPITSYVGSEGLRTESYNDAVTARTIYDTLKAGLVGTEAPSVVVHFDWGTGSTCTTYAGQTDGRYSTFSADVYVTWDSWLTAGPSELVHEYGHAWSLYHAHLDQQDPTMAGYLQARGLSGDPRVNSGYAWSTREMIAEDYRQLFGIAAAAGGSQTNTDIPPAAAVAGLREYLSGPFVTASAPAPAPAPAAAPTVDGLAMNPSPVSKTGTVTFSVTPATVKVDIVDANGTLVKTLLSGTSASGAVKASWNRTDTRNKRVTAGNYTVRVVATGSSGQKTTTSLVFPVV